MAANSTAANCSRELVLSQQRVIASDAFNRIDRATLVNFSDYSDFLDSEEFSDDNVNDTKTVRRWIRRWTRQGSRMNRFALTSILLLSVNWLVGCAALEVPYEPPGHACGWDPVFGACDTCGVCGGTCEGHTPGSWIGHQLRCTSGCGEIYWGPELNDPQGQCDPCDDCGDWVGDRCCEPKLRQRIWWTITGQNGPAASGKGCSTCGSKGCSSCGGKGCSSCDDEITEEPYYEPGMPTIAPHEAPTPEVIPAAPRPAEPEREMPAFIRPAQGVSFLMPFKIRSARLPE